MVIDEALLAGQTRLFEFTSYVRVIPSVHVTTPLGCVPAVSRFGGTSQRFAALYAAHGTSTALAETVVRDRFEGQADRRLFVDELANRAVVQIDTIKPLRLVDLRTGGCLKLGISTDIAGAKHFTEAQQFSDAVYEQRDIAGILYASRLTGESCVTVFDRAVATSLTVTSIAPLAQLAGLGDALRELNVELIAC